MSAIHNPEPTLLAPEEGKRIAPIPGAAILVVATVQRALDVTATGGPTILCVEDAHLLDEATADVLNQLVAGGTGPLLVTLAYRAEWIRTSLPRGIVELAGGDRVLAIELGPLGNEALAELIRLNVPVRLPEDADVRIVELAAGSPFFALELARADPGRGADIQPRTVRQAVMGRLAGLDAAQTDALAALAIAAATMRSTSCSAAAPTSSLWSLRPQLLDHPVAWQPIPVGER